MNAISGRAEIVKAYARLLKHVVLPEMLAGSDVEEGLSRLGALLRP